MKTKNKKNYKLIIFDFDGTLVDSAPGIHRTTNIMAKEYGMKPISEEKIKNSVGAGLNKFLEDIFKEVIYKYGLENIRKEYVKLYKENFIYKLKVFSGVADTLKILKKYKIKMVILSNKLFYFVKKSCQIANIYKFFDEIIGRGDLKKDKPDPYPVNYIAKKNRIKKENILLVGDSQYDAECAYKAGVDFFYLNYGYGKKSKIKKFKPIYISNKFLDLLKVINL